jgi:mannose-6-phosphate isomerase-like protein (cupin superfamily)
VNKVTKVDVAVNRFEISRDLSIAVKQNEPGPPKRIDGMTVGIVTLDGESPHGGEMHPDGDEILYVISGKIRVTSDSSPDEPLELGAGEACVVPKAEWHNIHLIEKAQFVHITPGPNGDARVKQLASPDRD